ncbi:DUF2490 domain-containing protein [Antarcticibacterium sp. 1MA-6-2]|uniref:DUF2490 domain-containing protein n=1 Tax=Antarcticibacterium sp. 1MA-6-2 TaxID=2908210 RepID=UPI001F330E50|nr:DUF2490 domain-containing protein [Antarcticibacterium sp. 1MA-6-2]UJH92895.1 DUF2490 domain-containing protein [Antarcticibacterium sp. 1MA-6-2]
MRNKIFAVLVCFFIITFSFSQDSQSFYYENEFEISIPLKNNWSIDFGAGNRGLLQEKLNGKSISGYQHEHLELNHFTKYKAKEFLAISLGLRYRFREIFDSFNRDEIRIIEQIEIGSTNSSLPISHRFRLEQRFREETIHRVRYALQFSRPLIDEFSVGLATEALFAFSRPSKPEAEQRFSLGFENTSFKDLKLGLDLEYRIENYTRTPGHEFFLITGVSFSL